jgi:hypothetical protein
LTPRNDLIASLHDERTNECPNNYILIHLLSNDRSQWRESLAFLDNGASEFSDKATAGSRRSFS